VAVRHAGHVGRLADYVEMAADQGMIGFGAASVGGGNIAPYGGMEPFAGTNPIAWGIPGPNGEHVVLDFATSAMSTGELLQHVAHQRPIPEGILLAPDGSPTTDYAVFRGPPRGVMKAFGGYKGSGLHMITEILGAAVTGNGLGPSWRDRGGPAVNGVLFQAIDVEEFMPLAQFVETIGELGAFVRSRKPAPGFDPPRLPGDGARERRALREAHGISLPDRIWSQLTACAESLHVTRIPSPHDSPRAV
jgi:LDH2 family malate/lactate/ureidoglycolate dehydrogenase